MKKGFTLIELLVVVLIIGILSAVALPQYEKAVWKSKSSQLKVLVKSIADAQELYFLSHGEYAKNMEDLDISFDSLSSKETTGFHRIRDGSTDPVRGNEEIVVGIGGIGGAVWTAGIFRKGSYQGGGFIYWHSNHFSTTAPLRETLCYAQGCSSVSTANNFCKKIQNSTQQVYEWYNNCSYRIP